MNKRSFTAMLVGGVVCFGTGLLIGSKVLQKTPAAQDTQSVTDASSFKSSKRGLNSPSELPAPQIATSPSSPAATGSVAASSSKESATVADLAGILREIRESRQRWDLGKLYQVLDRLDTNQFREALSLSLKTGDSWSRYATLYTLAARWGKIDPEAALAFVQSVENAS